MIDEDELSPPQELSPSQKLLEAMAAREQLSSIYNNIFTHDIKDRIKNGLRDINRNMDICATVFGGNSWNINMQPYIEEYKYKFMSKNKIIIIYYYFIHL